MKDILAFTEGLNAEQAGLMQALHKHIIDLPGITLKERYKLPFYYGRSWICYLNPLKDGSVELAFTRGIELSNRHGILEAKGRKQIAGIVCRQLQGDQVELVLDTLYEAIDLDRTKPYQHPGKRR